MTDNNKAIKAKTNRNTSLVIFVCKNSGKPSCLSWI